MFSKKLKSNGTCCRRAFSRGIISAAGLCGLMSNAANANALSKLGGLFSGSKDNFVNNYTTCLGVPSAKFGNMQLEAFDKTFIDIRYSHPLNSDGRWPIVICSVDEGADLVSYDLMVGALAARGYFVVLVMPSKIAPLNGIENKAHINSRRAQQVRFALDKIYDIAAKIGDDSRYIDFDNIGIAGHAEGAWTALELIGWSRGMYPSSDLADGRIKAAFSLMPTPGGAVGMPRFNDGPSSRVIYGRTLIAGNLDILPQPPSGSGVLGLELPSKSIGFGGLLGQLREKKRDEKPQREVLAAACAAGGMFFDWSLKGRKDRYTELLLLNGREIPQIGKKLELVRA
jgi:hypothetical protein